MCDSQRLLHLHYTANSATTNVPGTVWECDICCRKYQFIIFGAPDLLSSLSIILPVDCPHNSGPCVTRSLQHLHYTVFSVSANVSRTVWTCDICCHKCQFIPFGGPDFLNSASIILSVNHPHTFGQCVPQEFTTFAPHSQFSRSQGTWNCLVVRHLPPQISVDRVWCSRLT